MVNFLASNWVWILFLGGMLVMHLGHGGHGGHRGGCGGGHSTHDDAANTHDTGVDAADGDGDHSPVDALSLEMTVIGSVHAQVEDQLAQRRSCRHKVPGGLIRNGHCHFKLIALAGAIQLGFDSVRQLVQGMTSRHLMEIHPLLSAGLYLRIDHVPSHAVHMAGLAVLALAGVTAGLPLRVSSEHRQSGGIAVFMAWCTDVGRDMDR